MTEEENDVFANKPKANNFFIQLKRSFAITKKDLRIYYNKGPVVIQGILFPIVLFLAFTIGRNIQDKYVISGLMSMVLFLTATSIGPVVFPWETRQKTLERLIACPISIKTILLGNIWSSFLFGSLFSIIPLVLGASVFQLWSSVRFLILVPAIIVAALAFSGFSLILSVPPTDMPANTMILTIFIKFPVIFISPLFMPIDASSFVVISPLTYFLDIVNTSLGEASAFGSWGLLLDFGVLIAFGLIFGLLAFFLHGKTVHKRF
ncbi:MAG: ABC transporter permease [Candidatus Heimdallarchaeota archaeon]|nr:ABC transporter permease [Candidatus Heimdallarchaeota archaeon]